jgi:hypothetical protein
VCPPPDPDDMPDREWLFGYGSLVGEPTHIGARAGTPIVVTLTGYRRTWGVAMDNREHIPGYKIYHDPHTGLTPAVYVAFLDLAADPTGSVNGVCIPVTRRRLAELDVRERQYGRVAVRTLLPALGGRVWAYVGSAEGRARREEGDRTGTTVVTRAYLNAVLAGFDALGSDARAAFDATTDDCRCPVVELTRHDLPA